MSVTTCFAQSSVSKVNIKNETYYLTKEVGYPITGLYKYEEKGEPIVQLNEDGTGLFQRHEMSATKMIWGIECDEVGNPKKNQSEFGAVFRLWYQIQEKHKGKSWESGQIGEWDVVEFAISFTRKKMFILGERVKHYE